MKEIILKTNKIFIQILLSIIFVFCMTYIVKADPIAGSTGNTYETAGEDSKHVGHQLGDGQYYDSAMDKNNVIISGIGQGSSGSGGGSGGSGGSNKYTSGEHGDSSVSSKQGGTTVKQSSGDKVSHGGIGHSVTEVESQQGMIITSKNIQGSSSNNSNDNSYYNFDGNQVDPNAPISYNNGDNNENNVNPPNDSTISNEAMNALIAAQQESILQSMNESIMESINAMQIAETESYNTTTVENTKEEKKEETKEVVADETFDNNDGDNIDKAGKKIGEDDIASEEGDNLKENVGEGDNQTTGSNKGYKVFEIEMNGGVGIGGDESSHVFIKYIVMAIILFMLMIGAIKHMFYITEIYDRKSYYIIKSENIYKSKKGDIIQN